MQINSLAHLLKGLALPEPERRSPSLPAPRATPAPEMNKVAGNPVRVPINRQAALLLSPIRSWLAQPLPPEKLPNPHQKEINRLKAELKTERNEHALTRDALGDARAELRWSRLVIERLRAQVEGLNVQCREKDGVIAQLESLKL